MAYVRKLVPALLIAGVFMSACTSAPPTNSPGRIEPSGHAASRGRKVVDSRGETVLVPVPVKTLATVSDALVEEVIVALKTEVEVRAIGSTCLVREFSYDFTGIDGSRFSYSGGMNPANVLMPRLREQPLFIRPGTEMNFETLAKSKPDVLLIQAGCCTINWRAGDDQKMNSTLGKLGSLGIPTVVLNGPNFSGSPRFETLSDNIRILGQVFGKEESAQKLANFLESEVKLVSDRTKSVTEARKPRVLLFGLNPNIRRSGGSGTALGRRDIQSYMLEEVVHARNAFPDDSFSRDLNTEQVLALNPDVFILPTSNGYHPPRELYDTPDFANLGVLKAIRERRISALPWSPCNCDQRLEYPVNVMVMAKAAYPQLFSDINLEDWMVRFFRNVYRVDDSTANGLIDALWMNWARDRYK
jgi:iron complex transport system substrate-binding protein